MKKIAILLVSLIMMPGIYSFVSAQNKKIKMDHIEPPFWWVGMETPLQLMLVGEGIGDGTFCSLTEGVSVAALHRTESPNYLFADIKIEANAPAGNYLFRITSGKKQLDITYELKARREGSAQREGLSPADVLYLLMPDRFVNGNKNNDTTLLTVEVANPDKVYGRFGGDMAGINAWLDYFQSLGVTAVWPTPVTMDNEPTYSYHGYACADYYTIDPRFGSNLEYKALVADAKAHGIKFIQDFVVNHCGTAHWWMKDLPFKDWINTFPSFTNSNFAMSTHMDPHASQVDKSMCVRGWFDTSMADMNLTNPYVLQYFIQAAIWWMEYIDLAGLRIDTYPYSDEAAISAFTAALRKEYPNATVLAECWFNQPQQVAYWERGPRPGGPTVMDFPLQGVLCQALCESEPQQGPGMRRIYDSFSNDFVYDNPIELLIFADNHDTNRAFEQVGRNPEKMKMLYTMLATFRGIPQLYHGSELLVCAEDPAHLGHGEERRPMPLQWKEDPSAVQVHDYVAKVLQWRKTSEAVHSGSMLHYLPKYDENTYVYFRQSGSDNVMVVVNNGMKPYAIDWAHFAEGVRNATKGTEVISGLSVAVGEPVEVPAQTAWILTLQ